MKIHVRHSKREDVEAIKTIYTGREAVAGTLQLPYAAEHVWEERLAKPAPGVHTLVAESVGKENKNTKSEYGATEVKVVGHIVLSVNQNPRRNHSGTIGMAVLDGYSGEGIGTALLAAVTDLADNWLNLSRIELTVFKDNLAAGKLYEKSGFIVEGEARHFAFRDGAFVDALYMARIK